MLQCENVASSNVANCQSERNKMNKSKNLPAVVEPAVPEVMPPLDAIEEPDYTKPSERIAFHVGMAQHHGRAAIAHLILAGWELACQKQTIGYGGWNDWCEKNLQIVRITADRYIQFYQATVGAARNLSATPLAKKPTQKELSAATVGMEQKSATRAMIDIGVIKRSEKWGGANRGQGRKAKGEEGGVEAEVAAEKAASEASIRAELSAEEGRDLVKKLAGWALGADDGFGALSDGELARVVKTLKQVLARAEEIQSAREDAR